MDPNGYRAVPCGRPQDGRIVFRRRLTRGAGGLFTRVHQRQIAGFGRRMHWQPFSAALSHVSMELVSCMCRNWMALGGASAGGSGLVCLAPLPRRRVECDGVGRVFGRGTSRSQRHTAWQGHDLQLCDPVSRSMPLVVVGWHASHCDSSLDEDVADLAYLAASRRRVSIVFWCGVFERRLR